MRPFIRIYFISAIIILQCILLNAQTSVEDNASVPFEQVSFTGKITDARTGDPLVGASVYIADLRTGAATNQAGVFTINNISPGRHLVEISFVGYAGVTEYIDIRSSVSRDFSLAAAIVENNEVVVTGVSRATQLRRTPTPVTVVRRQEIMRITATNLVDALSRKPGISQLSTGPAISKPVIRGLGYNRVVVLNDGIRQEGQQWGDEHGIEIDEYSVNKIEILKGPASLMYGSDAMAGVINILTNVPVPEGTLRGNVLANYQTNNRLRGTGLNLSATYKTGFNWNVFGSLKAAADYSNRYDGRVYNSKFNEKNFGGYAGYNGSWGYSHLVISSFNQHAGIIEGDREADGSFIKPIPGGGSVVVTEADNNSVSPEIPWQNIRHNRIISDNNFLLGASRLSLTVGYQNNRRIEFGNVDDPSEKELFFDLGTLTYNAVVHLPEINQWRTAIGVNGMSQQNKNKGAEVLIPEYGLFDVGVFVYTQKTADKFTLSGGLRFDHRSLDSKYFEESGDVKFSELKRSFSNVSGSAGISYLPSPDFIIKFNVARGFRAPGIPELASNGTHEGTNRYEYGTSSLKSETSTQIDAGLEWNTRHLSVTANMFYNSIDNFIFYRKLAALGGGDSTVEVDGEDITAFKFDQQNAVLWGGEFTIDIHPHPLDWLHIENSLSLVRGRFNNAIDGIKDLPNIPAARLLSELRADLFPKGKFFRNGFLKFEIDNNFKQDHPFAAYGTETATGSYTLLNTGIGTDLVNRKQATICSIIFTVSNITDVAYQNHLNRLKYAQENSATGRMGVYNMGRNFSMKLNIPLNVDLKN
ncbi:MAG: TonB-dependent receptor [Chitinophagaceae bacterium]|nr:TonB-dependent receptor [Chitinophagaceae bacterium]